MNTLSFDQASRMVDRLTVVGERLEAEARPEWVVVAQAAALIEAIRLGLLAVAPAGNEGRQHHA